MPIKQIRKDRVYRFTGSRFNPRTQRTEPFDVLCIGAFAETRIGAWRHRDCVGDATRLPARSSPMDVFELDDGHLPGHRRRVSGAEVVHAMLAGPYPMAWPYREKSG